MKVTAYVALGANLGDPRVTVQAAIEALRGLGHARLLTVSSLYRTAPVGLSNQPDFINAVAAIEVNGAVLSAPTFMAPHARNTGSLPPTGGRTSAWDGPAQTFLKKLFAIEASFGRVRGLKNAPRTLDLDLLLFGDTRCATPGLTLPHPRLTERAFVLAPLAEIAPALIIDGFGRVADLLANVAGQRIERLA